MAHSEEGGGLLLLQSNLLMMMMMVFFIKRAKYSLYRSDYCRGCNANQIKECFIIVCVTVADNGHRLVFKEAT